MHCVTIYCTNVQLSAAVKAQLVFKSQPPASLHEEKHTFFCKNVMLNTINNPSIVLEITIS